MTAAINSITLRFITPRIIWMVIRAQQQPAQNIPCAMPTRSAPARPGRNACPRNIRGDRQCARQVRFQGDHWYSPAMIRAAPAAFGAARLMAADCIAAEEIAKPTENATAPNAIHTAKYPDAAKA